MDTNTTFVKGPFNCSLNQTGIGEILCATEGLVGPFTITATSVDDYGGVQHSRNIFTLSGFQKMQPVMSKALSKFIGVTRLADYNFSNYRWNSIGSSAHLEKE